MSLPMGDSRFGHQNGPNWQKMPPRGEMASHLLQRTLMQKTGGHMVSGTTGNFKLILAAKDACNDLITVFLGNDKSIMYSVLGQAFNVSMAHPVNIARLYDQIAVVVARPAPVASKNTRPPVAATFWIERDFSKVTRQAAMLFPGEVVNTVETLRTRLASLDPLGDGGGGGGDGSYSDPLREEERLAMHDQINRVRDEILSALSECFVVPAATLKKSFELGVVDEASLVLVRGAISYPLAKVLEKFDSSIAEGSTPGNWENNSTLQKTLFREYAKKCYETMYQLGKERERFLPNVIQTGKDVVRNIAHTRRTAIVYDPKTGTAHPLDGVLLLSHRAFRFVTTDPVISATQLINGYLLDDKPAFYKPLGAFSKTDAGNVVMIYEDEKHERETDALDEIIRTVREKTVFPTTRTQGSGIVRLSELGQRVLAGKRSSSEEEEKTETRHRHVLGTYRIKEPCLFTLHGGKAYAVDSTREYMPLRDRSDDDDRGRSSSLVALRHTLFRVTVGDLDEHHDQLNRWIDAVTSAAAGGASDKSGQAGVEPHRLFSVKSVTMHTPSLCPQRLTFGDNELRTAFMDPALYDAAKQEEALNVNLKNLAQRADAKLHFLTGLIQRKLSTAENADSLYRTYHEERTDSGDVHVRGRHALAALLGIALSPFFDVRTRELGQTALREFRFVKRPVYLAIPPYEMSTHVVLSRGLFLLAKGARESVIRDMNEKLVGCTVASCGGGGCEEGEEKVITRRRHSRRGEALSPPPPCLLEVAVWLRTVMNRLFGRASADPGSVNFLLRSCVPPEAEEGEDERNVVPDWLLIKYVLLPVLTRGKVRFCENPNAHVSDEGETVEMSQDDEVVLTEEATDDCDLFAHDSLFPEASRVAMSANTSWIVKKTNWPPILQAAALAMSYCCLTPTAISALLSEGCHPGFAVDFVRHEALYSEQAVFSTVHSHEMILSPGGVREVDRGDGSVELLVRGDIQTTRNTLGAGALLVDSVFPHENGIPRAETACGRPVISRDGITRTEYGLLENALAEAVESGALSEGDKAVVWNQLGVSTRRSRASGGGGGGGGGAYPDEFVPIVRPVRRPTEENPRSVLGIDKAVCVTVPGCENSVWERFYTSGEPSLNPYASEMGGLYSMRYTKQNAAILTGPHGFLLRTTNTRSDVDVPCSTTAALEELYDMSRETSVLTPHETSVITTMSAKHYESAASMIFKTAPCDSDVQSRPLLSNLDVPAVMGFAVPYTQTTDATLLDASVSVPYAPAGYAKILKSPTDYYIQSPFTVPPLHRGSM